MANRNRLPKLEPFRFHRLDLDNTESPQARGTCPFCDKPAHFYVSVKTGQWDCKVCGESGNIYTFLAKLLERGREHTTPDEYRELADNRGIPVPALKKWGLVKSILTDEWLIAVRNAEGKLANVLAYRDGKCMSTPGCKQHLLRPPGNKANKVVWVCEGPWDAMAWHSVLRRHKRRETVLAVPGSGTFKDEWREMFAGRDVRLLYDNDDPGRKGMQRAAAKLGGRAAKVCTLQWDEDLRDKYDIRDLVAEQGADKALQFVRARLEETSAGEEGDEDDDGQLVTTLYENIWPEKVAWLVQDRIPLGKITLLQGNPGVGKTYVACDLMARVSKGRSLPDGSTVMRGGAVLVTAEDGAADTIRPRLDLLGADLAKVRHLDSVQRDGRDMGMVSLSRDLGKLRRWLANNEDVRLIVFDPISAFLGERVDSHKNAEVRRALGPLKQLAEECRVAIVGINHLSKAEMRAIHRGQGSIAFNAQARAVWQVMEDPEDADRRLLLNVKMNLARARGLAFRIVDGGLQWERQPVDLTPDQVERPAGGGSRRRETEDWLRELLEQSNGRLAAKEVQARAKSAGFAWRTIKRVKAQLGVRACRETVPSNGAPAHAAWMRALPGPKSQAPASWSLAAFARLAERLHSGGQEPA